MIIKDRSSLATYNWGYIVVDEGHRLKNFNCKLVQEIKKYSSASRLILTGTPLHVSILPYRKAYDSHTLQEQFGRIVVTSEFYSPGHFLGP